LISTRHDGETVQATLIVYTTLPDEPSAHRLAGVLVHERLAACVNVQARMTSFYLWQGEETRETEHLLMIKTTEACYPALEQRIRAEHPYELPEIVATPITRGLEPYLCWIDENTQC
jgi:periplasmic divalent cation tolerance protein